MLLLIALVWNSPTILFATDSEHLAVPLYTLNNNPFTTVYGVPPMEPVRPLRNSGWEVRLSLDVVNNSITDEASGENLVLDGETYRSSLFLRNRLKDRWEISMELPYYHHNKSVFDNQIESWHNLFSLSTPNRDEIANNRLLFQYEGNGQAEFILNEPAGGPGDARISIARYIEHPFRFPQFLTVRLGIQLPTGDAQTLTGSDSTDITLDASVLQSARWFDRVATLSGRVGVVRPGDGSILANLQRHEIFYCNLGLGWQLWPRLAVKVQLDTHSAVFDSQLDPLGQMAWQVVTEATWSFSPGLELDFSILENFRRDPVPDVGMQLSFRFQL